MSESLKEKAKSASEIQDYTVQFFDKIRNAKNPEKAREEWMTICDKKEWVRLEDAEQEINKVKEGAKGTYRVMLEIELSLLKAEREKWKKNCNKSMPKTRTIFQESHKCRSCRKWHKCLHEICDGFEEAQP